MGHPPWVLLQVKRTEGVALPARRYRNIDAPGVAADTVTIERLGGCSNDNRRRRLAAYQAAGKARK